MGSRASSPSDVAHGGEAIEQLEAGNERQLRASESVDERLEHRRELRRLQTTETIGEFGQPSIAMRQSLVATTRSADTHRSARARVAAADRPSGDGSRRLN